MGSHLEPYRRNDVFCITHACTKPRFGLILAYPLLTAPDTELTAECCARCRAVPSADLREV